VIEQTATIVLPTGSLSAASVDIGARTIEGVLVPWNEVGQPAINGAGRRVKVRRSALRLAASVTGIDTHDRPRRDVSTLVASEDRPEGIWGRLKVDQGPAGDALLAAVADGKRLGLSVEANELQLDPTIDEVIGGVVDLVAHVDDPAFPSARVHAMTASLTTPTTTPGEPSVTAPTIPAPAADPAAPVVNVAAPAIDYTALAAAIAAQPALQAALAPVGLPTGSLPQAPAPVASPGLAPSASPTPTAESDPVMYAATLQAACHRGEGGAEMQAALADITNSGMPLFQNRSTLGEKLWEGAGYTRQFVNLFRQKALTDWEFTGWQWVERPRVQDYAGDKGAVPSNPVSVVGVKGKARRLAGAWDIDRKFVDFSSPEFWAEFWAAGTESYLEESDARAAQALVDYAIDLTTPGDYPTLEDEEGNTVYTYALPAGYATGAGGLVVAQADVLQAAALATAVLEDTPRVKRAPDYIVMNTADWLSLTSITNLDLPAFLSMLKIKPENFMRSSKVTKGTIIAGVTPAATFRELGSVPIRVEALDIAKGGVDRGLFGYTGVSMDRPGGIISLPLAAG
jgi:hypothetical protein